MIKFKKFLILALSLILVFSLSACGEKDKNKVPDTPPQQETPIPEVTEQPTETESEIETEPEAVEPEIIIADIGNIVRLKNDDVALLIIGKDFTDETFKTKYEYISVMYPAGIKESNTYYGFNYEDITEVLDVNNIILREDLNFVDGESYTATKVSTDLNMNAIEALTKEASKYTVYQKTTTETGITIGVSGLEYSHNKDRDVLIFDLVIENNSESEIIANGRLDITLKDKNNSQNYDCNDALIEATDIINFRINTNEVKEGRIAFEIPSGTAENMVLTYESTYIPATNWYISEVNIIK